MGLIWSYTNNNVHEWATNEPEKVRAFRTRLEIAAVWFCLRHVLVAFSNPWLATVIDTRMPIQECGQWADNFLEQVNEQRGAWLTIPFV